MKLSGAGSGWKSLIPLVDLLRLLSWIEVVAVTVAVADFCVYLLFQNEEAGYPRRHSLGGSDGTLGYIWMD